MLKSRIRTEADSLGQRDIPADSLFGIHTARAVENFRVTGVTIAHFPELIRALAMTKLAAARANSELGVLAAHHHDAIAYACERIMAGAHHDAFVVDMIQGGAGTSTNMNVNEVIANLGLDWMGHAHGDYAYLHPNDHVNRSQSTNDVYPTAIRLAVMLRAESLLAEQARLAAAFRERATAFADLLKVGRTQLQDAVPMSLGDEFASFASSVEEDAGRLREVVAALGVVNLGGTAIGTGITTPPGYGELALRHLAEISGLPVRGARDLIDASSNMGDLVSCSGILRRLAIRLSKICNDLRLLSSGPRAGIGEIELPAVQAGSSIMPGKVNPVIPEMVSQVAYEVIGNDLTITLAAEAGQLQLNPMEPVIACNLLESLSILTNAMRSLTDRCVPGITANAERCRTLLEESMAMGTVLASRIGYDRAAALAKEALQSRRPLADVVLSSGLMTRAEFDTLAVDAVAGDADAIKRDMKWRA
jgi:aspartate ammonia-lyase